MVQCSGPTAGLIVTPRHALLVGLLAASCSFDTRGIAPPGRQDHRVILRDGPAAERALDLAPGADLPDAARPEQAIPCTPQSCPGCCSGQTCHPGTATGLCGKAGDSCIDCNVTSMICSAGVCTAPCASSSQCGGEEVCIPPHCVPPYARDYTLTILSAQIGAGPLMRGDWDYLPGHEADPFCVVRRAGTDLYTTKVIADTQAPAWTGASFVVRIEKGVELEIECLDDDGITDDTIGTVTWSPEVPASALKAGSVTATGSGALQKLVVSFTPK
jgi:hypothetical protein